MLRRDGERSPEFEPVLVVTLLDGTQLRMNGITLRSKGNSAKADEWDLICLGCEGRQSLQLYEVKRLALGLEKSGDRPR